VGQEAEATGRRDRVDDPLGVEPGVHERLVEAEREVVVRALGRDLLADADERRAVPALLAGAARRQRVVVGQQDRVDAGARARGGDLRDRARPVRVTRVDVDDAGGVVERRRGH